MKKSNLIRIGLIGCLWLLMAGISIQANPNAYASTNIANLKWNTFLEGSSETFSNNLAKTPNGEVFVTGWSSASWGNPLKALESGRDAFVAKLDANGNLIWNTFVGGTGHEFGYAVAATSDGGVVIIGEGGPSWGNPIRQLAGITDVFVAKLDLNGNPIWHTFLGGIGVNDRGFAITVASNGNIIVTGSSDTTWGNPLRSHTQNQDAFVASLDTNGNLLWNTFLGGTQGDDGYSLAPTTDGGVMLAARSGSQWGSPLRPYAGGTDAFVARLGANGNLIWQTFLGGVKDDGAYGIVLTPDSGVLITGYSNSTWGNPIQAHSGNSTNAFVARLDSNGVLIWNTFLGSGISIFGNEITLTSDGGALLIGQSGSAWGSPLSAYIGNGDAFLARLDSNGNLLWHTFLGGQGGDAGIGLTLTSNNGVIITGNSSKTWGSPIRPHSGDPNVGVFVARVDNVYDNTALPTPPTIPTSTPIPATATPNQQNPTATPVRPTATPIPATATPITPQPSLSATPTIEPSATTNPVAPSERKVMAFIPFLNQYIDNFEPNNAVAQAYPIRINETIKASVKAQGDPRDYYQIRLRPDRQYKITLSVLGDGDLNLHVYDDAQLREEDVVKKSNNEGNVSEMVTFKPRKDTIHYVLASTFASEGPQNYELLVIEQ